MAGCSISECTRAHYGRGLCNAHYQRLRKGQVLSERSAYDQSPAEKFAGKYVVAGGGCWNWKSLRKDGRANTFRLVDKIMSAYRASYILHKGPIPDGALVCHTCDNPACVNPDHLWLGSYADNTNDMLAKGRGNTANGLTKLTKLGPEQVREIRALLATGKVSQRSVARSYGVSHGTVQDLANGKTWRHVS
jgi:hypothetical protein